MIRNKEVNPRGYDIPSLPKKEELTAVEVPLPPEVKLGFSDYWNICKGFFRREALVQLGFENPTNYKLVIIIFLGVVIGLILLKIL